MDNFVFICYCRFLMKGDDMEFVVNLNGLMVELISGVSVLEFFDVCLSYLKVEGK